MTTKSKPIIISNASAFCYECNKTIAHGPLEISVSDSIVGVSIVSGPLFFETASHHNKLRKRGVGSQEFPLHNKMTIYNEGGVSLLYSHLKCCICKNRGC